MRRFSTLVLFLGLAATAAAGCGRARAPIPAGAQVVHVTVIESELRLDRTTVRAGDVYIVLETPRSGVGFASRTEGPVESGPLSDGDIARLAAGDTQGLGISAFGPTGCSNEQRAEDLGLMGPCGNVFKVALVAGSYAFLGPGWTEQAREPLVAPTAGPPGSLPRTIAVLRVLP